MKRLLFYALLVQYVLLFFGQLTAQIPAATLFQAPLLLHPAMAGNTGKHRVAVLANRNDYYVPVTKEPQEYEQVNKQMSYRTVYDNATNLYASYDRLWKGYGIGAFATYNATPSQTNCSQELRSDYGSFSSQGYSVGVIVSPKLKIPHPVLPGEVKYTIAPSLMLSYKGGSEASIMSIPSDNYVHFKPTSIEKSFQIRQFTTQLGMLVNSKRGYVGYNLGLVYDMSTEKNYFYRDQLRIDKQFTSSYLGMHHNVCIGWVFSRKETSAFTFSPVTSVGISHSLFGRKSESIYQSYMQTGTNWFGYLHQSLNCRYKWLLFGGSYTEYQNQRMAAYHLGVKISTVRCTLFYSFWDKQTTKMEASLQFLF